MINSKTKKTVDIYNKKITVIGLGLSGMGAAKLANFLGAKVFASDKSKKDNVLYNSMELMTVHHIANETGLHSDRIYDADLWIVSPGISKNEDIIRKAENLKIPIIGEIEFSSWFTHSKIIAITGSNGKTTTASILYKMCKYGNRIPVLAGNIGIPFSERVENEIKNPNTDNALIYILECSSFQMEFINDFKPDLAIYTNITEDHLDRHGTMKEYVKMKMQLSKNMNNNDLIIYNADDQTLINLFENKSNNYSPFSLNNEKMLFHVKNNDIYSPSGNLLININKLKIPGKHNLYNFLAAATCAHSLGIPVDHIKEVMKNFNGIEHRLEYVTKINEIAFFNDSKSTNIHSVIVAIKSFYNPIILILGGYNKGTDFRLLLPHIKSSHVRDIVSYGEAGGHINTALGDAVRSIQVDDLNSAVNKAHLMAAPGDIVLLSPGCASYDQFPNYEVRGKFFKKFVNNLVSK